MKRFSAPLLALLVPVLAFATGWLARDELVAPQADPPRFVAEYVKAFCAADGAYVAAHSAGLIAMSTEEANEIFAKRAWQCDRVRYLGSSAGKRGTAYLFVLQDGPGGLQNWWAFTTASGGKVQGEVMYFLGICASWAFRASWAFMAFCRSRRTSVAFTVGWRPSQR